MDHSAGLDVSVKETSICIVDDAGRIVREVKVASEPEVLLAVLKHPAYHFKRIGLEAGPLSQWLFSAIAEAGLPVIRRLPPVRVQGYFNTWPSMVVEFADRVGQPEPMRLPPPSPAAISRMEETLVWLRWLEAEDAKLVWARSDRTPWKAICWRFGIGRATAHRRWQYGLSVIAWRLNGRKAPAKRSRQFVVAVAARI